MLLDDEITPATQQATAAELDRQQKSRTTRANKMARIEAATIANPPTADELRGATIYVDDHAPLP